MRCQVTQAETTARHEKRRCDDHWSRVSEQRVTALHEGLAVMKLEIVRGLFVAAALSVASIAAAAWHEPGTQVVSQSELGLEPLSPRARTVEVVRPDQDLLLFMFSLSQGMGPQG